MTVATAPELDIVRYNRETEAFSLPPEHARLLADTESPSIWDQCSAWASPIGDMSTHWSTRSGGRWYPAGRLRRALLVRLRAFHGHRVPSLPVSGVDSGTSLGGRCFARPRFRRRNCQRARRGPGRSRALRSARRGERPATPEARADLDCERARTRRHVPCSRVRSVRRLPSISITR